MTHADGIIRRAGQGLSARLLVLTIFFVLLSEVLIFLPSIARFRVTYLEEHLTKAHLVVEALRTTRDRSVSRGHEMHLLDQVGAHAIGARRPGAGKLMLMREPPDRVDASFDLRESGPLRMIREALVSLFGAGDRVLRVVGRTPDGAGTVEVVIDERPLTLALRGYGERVLALSLIISFITAALVYMSLHLLMVRPMRRLTASMTRFRQDPENAANRIAPTDRLDEIGTAESELAAMQSDLATALHQKTRLAALGIAMTKISHDLKNILATAQLISDRLTSSDDPEVRRVAPRLERAIDRAVNLCMQTLNFTREGPPSLDLSSIALADLVDEVAGTLPAAEQGKGHVDNRVPPDLGLRADRGQLYRVLVNLLQNAIEAGATTVTVTAAANGDAVEMRVADDGPGLPPRAQENLFQPFSGTVKRGGTGLGLAIARDLVRAHGGDLTLGSTSGAGTTFHIHLTGRETAPGATDRANTGRAVAPARAAKR
jgi:signal transduction histidine kinase